MVDAAKQKKDNPIREQLARAMAKIKPSLDKAQAELDKQGVERKELTPDMVDGLREGLMSIYVNADEEAHEAAMQLVVEVIAEAQPETDVEEERAEDEEEKQDGEEDEEKEEDSENKAIADTTKELAEMAKAHNDLIGDVVGVVELLSKTAEIVKAQAEEKQALAGEIKTIKKQLSQRPRRASKADETILDADSELGKEVDKQLVEVVKGYEDMFSNGGSA